MKRNCLALSVLLLAFFIPPCLAGSEEGADTEIQQNLTAEDRKILDMLELLEILELLDNMEEVAALEDN